MIKKFLPLVVAGAVVLVILGAFTVTGWDNFIADLNYQYLDITADKVDEKGNVTGKETTLSWYIGVKSDLDIPRSIYGYEVVGLGSTFGKKYGYRIETIKLHEKIRSIESGALQNCENLRTVYFSEGLKTIGSSAFLNCTAITKIDLPSGVISIGSSAFSGCTSLNNITIPESVEEIGENAFDGCTGLTSVIYKGETYDYEHINDIYKAVNR